MSDLWRRLRRLLRQNRIRLSAADLGAPAPHPGDRLRIASSWWRVCRTAVGPSGVTVCELAGDGLPERTARLSVDGGSRHCLFDDGALRAGLPWVEVLHLPAGGPSGRGQNWKPTEAR